jgi:hypothetical protein
MLLLTILLGTMSSLSLALEASSIAHAGIGKRLYILYVLAQDPKTVSEPCRLHRLLKNGGNGG